jgi:hypothetical protein
MHKDVLRAIAGIDMFPVVSLVIFVVTFALVVISVLHMDRASVDERAALPLDGGAAAGDPAQHPVPSTRHFPGESRGA